LAIIVGVFACALLSDKETPQPQESEVFVSAPETPHTTMQEAPATPEEPPADPWTQEELEAMARTLSGECYDDKQEDKRKVCEVILNRVSAGRYGDGIISVITAKGQFCGYWNPSREISANDLEIAGQALRDWFAGDCAPLSEYLYFTAGANRENAFREIY
jgi:hypothetical protein